MEAQPISREKHAAVIEGCNSTPHDILRSSYETLRLNCPERMPETEIKDSDARSRDSQTRRETLVLVFRVISGFIASE